MDPVGHILFRSSRPRAGTALVWSSRSRSGRKYLNPVFIIEIRRVLLNFEYYLLDKFKIVKFI